MKTSNLDRILTRLNLNADNGLLLSADLLNADHIPDRVSKVLINIIKPDAVFCIENKPIILFFDNTDNIKDFKTLSKQIWNLNEIPVVIWVDANAVDIYNGFNLRQYDYIFQLERFDDADENDFEYYKLVTGETWSKDKYKTDTRTKVDYKLLYNIKMTQREIVAQLKHIADDHIMDDSHSISLANSLIARVIYIRYLIDRTDKNGEKINIGFVNDDGTKLTTNIELCDLLTKNHIKPLFEYLKYKFNGDLFKFTENEYSVIARLSFEPLIKLLTGHDFVKNQDSLDGFEDLYDFSIIPVELISHIYELFLGEKQKDNAAYYTPLFLVDYVLSQTFTQKNHNQVCKVLDPSCGSGVFLVEALRKNIEYYKRQHSKKDLSPDELKEIVQNNIFGIDKDEQAVEIAILSIYLILLGEQTSKEIEQFEFPNLLYSKSLDTNLDVAAETNKYNFFVADYFDEAHQFNKILQDQKIDFIVGNPPWGTTADQKLCEEWYYKQYGYRLPDKQISQAFLLRNLDFSIDGTSCAMVVTSKNFYNQKSAKFRAELLASSAIRQVLELSLLRKDLFEAYHFNEENNKYEKVQVTNPSAVLIYNKSDKVANSKIQHICVKPSRLYHQFKIIAVYKPDIQYIPQKLFVEHDYLWKISMMGTWVDFNVVKKIKTNGTMEKYREYYLNGVGYKKTDNTKKSTDTAHLLGRRKLESQEIFPFYIADSEHKFNCSTVGDINAAEKQYKIFFTAPMLVIRHSFNKADFKLTAAMQYQDCVFTNSVNVFRPVQKPNRLMGNQFTYSEQDIHILKIMAAFINSTIARYWTLMTVSSAMTEREQSYFKETASLPFIYDEQLLNYVNQIEQYYQTRPQSQDDFKLNPDNLPFTPDYVQDLMQKIDDRIFALLKFSQLDKIAIDYAINCTIPLLNFKYNETPHEINSPIRPLEHHSKDDCDFIKRYVQVILQDFNKVYGYSNLMVTADIRITSRTIAIFFKIKPKDDQLDSEQLITINNPSIDDDNAIKLRLHSLGISKTAEKMYLIKDVRGFEKDGFYIIKANEKRLWHQYHAYIDLEECVHAIHQSGR